MLIVFVQSSLKTILTIFLVSFSYSEQYQEKKISREINFISDIQIFSHWSFHKIKFLYWSAMIKYVSFNSLIYEFNSESQFFYIIKDGEYSIETDIVLNGNEINSEEKADNHISLMKKPEIYRKSYSMGMLGPGEFFGHDELLEDSKRKFRIKSVSSKGVLFCYSKKEFFKIVNDPKTKDKLYIEMNRRILMMDERIKECRKNYLKLIRDRQKLVYFRKTQDVNIDERLQSLKEQSSTSFMFQTYRKDLKKIIRANNAHSQDLKNETQSLLSQEIKAMNQNSKKKLKSKNRKLTDPNMRFNEKETFDSKLEQPEERNKQNMIQNLKKILNPVQFGDFMSPMCSIRSINNTALHNNITNSREDSIDMAYKPDSNHRKQLSIRIENKKHAFALKTPSIQSHRNFEQKSLNVIITKKEEKQKLEKPKSNIIVDILPLKYKALEFFNNSKPKNKIRKGKAHSNNFISF